MSYDSNWRNLRKQIVSRGFTLKRVANGHEAIFAPDGHHVAQLPTSPSGNRGLLNKRAELRRKGVL